MLNNFFLNFFSLNLFLFQNHNFLKNILNLTKFKEEGIDYSELVITDSKLALMLEQAELAECFSIHKHNLFNIKQASVINLNRINF